MDKVIFHINDPDAIYPTRATDGSAGIDIHVIEVDKEYNGTVRYDTGLSVEIPKGYTGFLIERSSLHSKQELTLANKVGVIDSDYRGNIMVCLDKSGNSYNKSLELPFRAVQLVILETPKLDIKIEDGGKISDINTGESARSGGFGSTG